MKKLLFLFLLIVPIIGFGQKPSDITLEDVLKEFGDPVVGYWSDDWKILFDGGDFNIKSPDVAKVKYYEMNFGALNPGGPNAWVAFEVLDDGSKHLYSIRFRRSEEGKMPQIYYDLNRYLLNW
jgi:hypothetical protein